MSEELVTIGKTNTSVEQQTPVFVDNTGLGDLLKLKPSRLTLVHATTLEPQGAKPGQILDTDSGAVYDEVEVVLLKSRIGRTYFPEGSVPSKSSEPLCRSMNGVVPVADVKAKQANTCKACPKAVWLNGKPSACKMKLELVVARPDDMMPYYLGIGGRGISPVKNKLESVMKQAQVGFNKGRGTQIQNFVLTFKGVKNGAFHNYDIVKITQIDNDTAAPFIAMVNEIDAQVQQKSQVDNEVAADSAVDSVIEGEFVQEV